MNIDNLLFKYTFIAHTFHKTLHTHAYVLHCLDDMHAPVFSHNNIAMYQHFRLCCKSLCEIQNKTIGKGNNKCKVTQEMHVNWRAMHEDPCCT